MGGNDMVFLAHFLSYLALFAGCWLVLIGFALIVIGAILYFV